MSDTEKKLKEALEALLFQFMSSHTMNSVQEKVVAQAIAAINASEMQS